MARGNIRGPLGPIMLGLLACIAIFMIYATQTPGLGSMFKRPDGFYDNMLEKVGTSLLFAGVVTAIVVVGRKLLK